MTLIIGPPGTGKTTTLCDLIGRYLRLGLSVLLVSHTNIATDNAFIRLIDAMTESEKEDLQTLMQEGLVVRAGEPRHASLQRGTYRKYTVNGLVEARTGKQIALREELERAHQILDGEIELAIHKLSQREAVWLPARKRLRKQMEALEQKRDIARQRQAEREEQDRVFFQAQADLRKAAQQELDPLKEEERQLTASREDLKRRQKQAASDKQKATEELQTVQAMTRLQRAFSRWRGYDVDAQMARIERHRRDYLEKESQIAEVDRKLHQNRMKQSAPSGTIYRSLDDEKRRRYILKEYPSPFLKEIRTCERELAPLSTEFAEGEQPGLELKAEIESKSKERTAMETRIADLKAQQEGLKAQIVADAQLVTTTITGVYVNANLLEREFDVVVVDEVSMISTIGVLLAASRATQHFVGAGDPMQLSPVVKLEHERDAPHAREWLGKDLFSYLGVSIFDARDGKKECCLLTEQGRSHPTIIAPINHFVYLDLLTSRKETENAPGIAPYPEWPLLLVDTSQTEASCIKQSKSQPRTNDYHADVSVVLAQQALESLPPRSPTDDPTFPRVAIIAPYRSQAHLVQKKLREAKIAHLVHTGTINTVQSLEFPVVVFDTVEAPGIRPWQFTFDTILDSRQMATEATRKLNVGWTRARYKLMVIAHRQHLHAHLPHHREENPQEKQRLLVDLVDWAYDRGHMNAAEVVASLHK
jgi:superfamily I DNA and/or RNA helicase